MRIFLYEFVTGGGWLRHASHAPPEALAAEGLAMVSSLAADFVALPDVSVDVMRDARYRDVAFPQCALHEVRGVDEELAQFEQLAAAADWTVVIAPEFCGYLHDACRRVECCEGRLLGPGPRAVALAGDKHATAEHLARCGVRVPPGVAVAAGAPLPVDFPYPGVLKPRDGAGSLGVERIDEALGGRRHANSPARLEKHCPGMAASVALLCGPGRIVPLVPCRQLLGGDGGFAYLGGSLPIAPRLADRATDLAVRAAGTLPGLLGYMGVDLVLGDDPGGADDVVIEINPRLTTSYVGLRALSQGNLAAAMLAVAQGDQVELCWQSGPIQFEATGRLR